MSKHVNYGKYLISNGVMKIEKLLPGIQKNISLKTFTTFKIGGKTKYFLVAKKKENIIKAVRMAKQINLPFFILGGGSNLLISDEGFKGLVVKIQNVHCLHTVKYSAKGGSASGGKIQDTEIYTEAGVPLSLLINKTIRNNLSGLEWAVGIPGTVGGAVHGNAGFPKESFGDIIKEVEVFDSKDLKIKKLNNKDCKFGYRESIFKKRKNLIIISAILELKSGNKGEIKNKIQKYLEHRKASQPLNFPSIGSIFKNPPKFFAGELIEKCNLKGKKIGNVKISEKHANFIVNLGNGKANDVKKLINLIKNRVKNKFGVVLEEEIQYLGFQN